MTTNSYHWVVITKKSPAAKLFDWERTSPSVVRRRLEVAGDELELPAEVAVRHHPRLLPEPHLRHAANEPPWSPRRTIIIACSAVTEIHCWRCGQTSQRAPAASRASRRGASRSQSRSGLLGRWPRSRVPRRVRRPTTCFTLVCVSCRRATCVNVITNFL